MIKPLTSLRFIFAFMVFASHLGYLNGSNSTQLNWLYNNVLNEGYIGVSFFFILSGFVLSYNYQEGLINKQKSIRSFYFARFARIYPLHLLTFIISIPLTYHTFINDFDLWTKQAISNLTLTQSFIPMKQYYFSFNSPSWSISDEMFFYIVFPALVLLIPKLKKSKNTIILFCLAFVPLLTLIVPYSYYHQIFYINPLIRVFDFIIGIMLYNLFNILSRKEIKTNFSIIEFSAILILLIFFSFHQRIPDVDRYSFYYWIPMSCIILAFSFERGVVSKILSNRLFIHLGEISFGFYLFHQLVIRYLNILNLRILKIDNDLLLVIIAFSISLLVSHFSYIWYEIPLKNQRRWSMKAKTLPPQ